MYEYRIRAYFTEVYAPRSYKRKIIFDYEEAKKLLEEAKNYYATYKYLRGVVIEKREVGQWERST